MECPDTVNIGTTFSYSITIPVDSTFHETVLPPFDNANVEVYMGPSLPFSNSISIVNGKKAETHRRTYKYIHQALFTLASIDAERGNVAEADSLFNISMNFLLSNMKPLWRYSTPSQRELFWKGTLILTLWKVRDSVAESFATTFYKELMNQEGHKRQAFEKTKNIIREKFKDSFDWACFVMVD